MAKEADTKQNWPDEQAILQKINDATLMDDLLFNVVMQYHPAALEKIIRIILGKDVALWGAEFGDKRRILVDHAIIDLEIVNESNGANAKRARRNVAMLDTYLCTMGIPLDNWDDVETVIVLITKTDVLNIHTGLKRFSMHAGDMPLNDGSTIIYVNGEYKGEDIIGQMIHDLQCSDYHDIIIDEIREAVKFTKSAARASVSIEELQKRLEDYKAGKTA